MKLYCIGLHITIAIAQLGGLKQFKRIVYYKISNSQAAAVFAAYTF